MKIKNIFGFILLILFISQFVYSLETSSQFESDKLNIKKYPRNSLVNTAPKERRNVNNYTSEKVYINIKHIDKSLYEISKSINKEPEDALSSLLSIVNDINNLQAISHSNTMLIVKDSSPTGMVEDMDGLVLDKIKSWLPQIKTALAQIAEKLKAATYSISTGLPSGISISLTWERK